MTWTISFLQKFMPKIWNVFYWYVYCKYSNNNNFECIFVLAHQRVTVKLLWPFLHLLHQWHQNQTPQLEMTYHWGNPVKIKWSSKNFKISQIWYAIYFLLFPTVSCAVIVLYVLYFSFLSFSNHDCIYIIIYIYYSQI